MAPEQILGKKVDETADIYSVGVIMYEMATGERPFQGNSVPSLIRALVASEPASISIVQPLSPPIVATHTGGFRMFRVGREASLGHLLRPLFAEALVRSKDGDAAAEAHQLGEHFRPRYDRNGCLLRSNDLRVGVLYRRGGVHHIRTLDLVFVMALEYNSTEFDQAPGDVRGFEVGSGHLVAQIEQQFGDAAHSDSADSYKMNMIFF